VLSGLLRLRLPALNGALAACGVHGSMWATQWLMTVFSYSLPLPSVARIWDAFLCEGWKVPLRCVLAILKAREASLLAAARSGGFEALLSGLKEAQAAHPACNPDELMASAFAIRGLSWAAAAELLAEEAWLREQGREQDVGSSLAGTFIRGIPKAELQRLLRAVGA
jgi:hypothetical protein